MHELSIALSIIEGAEEAALGEGGHRVTAVHVRVGPLSGVVPEALSFSFGIATEGTSLEGARLIIRDVPVRIYCATCRVHLEPAAIQCLRCPQCGGSDCDVTEGDELELCAIEMEEENVAAPFA